MCSRCVPPQNLEVAISQVQALTVVCRQAPPPLPLSDALQVR
jgi:transformation/transcription domain-associated protein